MSDHPTPEPQAAPAAAAPEIPTIITPTVAAPASESVAAPIETATILTPQATPEVVVEATPEPAVATPAPPTAEIPKAEPSLLETAGKEPAKPEAKPEDKPADAPSVDAAAYEPFKLPEGLTLDESRIKAFTDVIGPHKLDQETAQKLVDLHTETMVAYQSAIRQAQLDAFAETKRQWRTSSVGDEQIGGAGHQTAMMAAARMRDLLVPESRRAAFAKLLADTGIGDHPEFIRIFHNAARLYDEPAPPPIPARPVPDRGGNGKLPRQQQMYDHPSSRRAAGRG